MKLNNLTFKKCITATGIKGKVRKLALRINKDYHTKAPLFLPVLNGSFLFAADLIKQVKLTCQVSFVKHASYEGTSGGQLKTLIGLNESVFGKDIIVVEDIMDSGDTLTKVVEELKNLGAKSVEVVVLLRKAKVKKHVLQPKYVGFEIPDKFVVGYGLDLNGLGRNLVDVYQMVE